MGVARSGLLQDFARFRVRMHLGDAAHELLNGLAPMIASDVRADVEPDALDAVVVRAIGRQEVEDHAATELANSNSGSSSSGSSTSSSEPQLR